MSRGFRTFAWAGSASETGELTPKLQAAIEAQAERILTLIAARLGSTLEEGPPPSRSGGTWLD